MSISHAELQDAAREMFADGVSEADPEHTWKLLVEMGWLGICVPEHMGGLNLSRAAQAILHLELGRALGPGGVAVHLAVTDALIASERKELIERAISGELMTASMRLESLGERAGTISGRFDAVPDADRAKAMLIAVSDRLLLMPLDRPDVEIAECTLWDKSRRFFAVTLDRAPIEAGHTLASGERAAMIWDNFNVSLLLAIAADSLGGASVSLGMTVDYLTMRRQFDRPLAMFQALKHRCADMKARLAGAEALFGTQTRRDPTVRADVAEAGAMKAHAARIYEDIAEESVQLHGGIGLTQEHHCHRFLKRAFLNATLGGSADVWEEAYGRALTARLLSNPLCAPR